MQIIAHHRLRAAHQVYTGPDLKEVKLKGQATPPTIIIMRRLIGVEVRGLEADSQMERAWDWGGLQGELYGEKSYQNPI